MAEQTQQDYERRDATDSVFHWWINQRQEQRREAGEPWEHDLYEWKSALREIDRLPYWLKGAREGTLSMTHQQCSHSAPETLPENRVVCALGCDVTECPILQSVYASVAEAKERYAGFERYATVDPDEIAARVCCWHIFTEKLKHPYIDTSEGYVQDESDRRFWDKVYSHLSFDGE